MNQETQRAIVRTWLRDYPVTKHTDRDEVLWKMSRRFAYLSATRREQLLDAFLKGEAQ
jgi:hypothetical protein